MGIFPIELELRKAAHCSAVRLAGIPTNHPLRSKVNHETGRLGKELTHACSIRKLFVNFKIDPRRFAITPNTNDLPPAVGLLNPHVAPGGKKEAIEDEKNCMSTVKVYTDGSMVGGHVGVAAVLSREGREAVIARKHVGSDREHEVYEAEIIGLLMGLELLSREREVVSATIFIDNQAVIQTIQTGTTRNLGYLFAHLDEATRVVRENNRGVKLELRWIPGHNGVMGNEKADEAAKQAAEKRLLTENLLPDSIRGTIPINPTAAKRTRRVGMGEEWKDWVRDEGLTTRTKQFTANIDDTYPSTEFYKNAHTLSRSHFATLTQLRTGHYPTACYLYRFTLADSPRCPLCNAHSETVVHLLMGCRALSGSRRERDQAMGAASRSLKALLKPGAQTELLFKYLQEAKRLAAGGQPQTQGRNQGMMSVERRGERVVG